MSVASQHILRDMIELEMYLVSEASQKPWSILPRRSKNSNDARKPHSTLVESSAAMELVNQGFVETTSSRTFVVSKSGYQFYEQEMKD
jgi:hypothetical protein